MSDAYLSSTGRETMQLQKLGPRTHISAPNTPEALRRGARDKKEKMEFNQMMMRSLTEGKGGGDSRPLSYHGRSGSLCLEAPPLVVNKRHIVSSGGRSKKESSLINRRSMPIPYLENRLRDKIDVLELDTNLPRIDLEKIEIHLRQAREEERKYRSDREEIRRRLALEGDWGDPVESLKPRKHNLQSRLQTSMNLQVCFMNETTSDNESPNSDVEGGHQNSTQNQTNLPSLNKGSVKPMGASGDEDFVAKHCKLQAEVRNALAQAKEVARLQLAQEREGRAHSPITEMVRNTLEKVGVGLPSDRRRMSRQMLTEINVTQLQVIVNDLHSHIEKLNETLVRMLLERDDLHMEQDSMLVDIEDLTRYL